MSNFLLKKIVKEGRKRGATWREIVEDYEKETGRRLSIDGLRSTARKRGWTGTEPEATSTKMQKKISGNTLTITTKSLNIKTVDDLIEYSKVDLEVWKPDTSEVTTWDTTLGAKTSGTGKPETVTNYRVFARFKMKGSEDIIKRVLEDLKKTLMTKKVRVRARNPQFTNEVVFFMSLFDHHFGKLAWALETGTDYDIKIARSSFIEAVEDLLERSSGYHISKIVFPIGNDYFQFDNFLAGKIGVTTKGTPQDTDGRMAKILREGMLAMVEAVELCAAVAPTEVIWIPGNHDWNTSFGLANVIEARFWDDPRITVDVSPNPRKYRRYGKVLIGLTHGNEEKHPDLPIIMAQEAKQDWAKAEDYMWFLGHFHRRKETRFNAGETFGAVQVRIMPSLSGTDAWHHKKGYVKTDRAAEGYYFHPTEGYIGHISVKIRPKYRGKV